MKPVCAIELGSRLGYDFYNVRHTRGVYGIAALGDDAKKAYKEAKSISEKLSIVVDNIVAKVHEPCAGYWNVWLVSTYAGIPDPKNHLLFTIGGYAWSIDYKMYNWHQWWRLLARKDNRWVFDADHHGVSALGVRPAGESVKIVDHINKLTDYIGPTAKILAKVDRRNGNILVKLNASFSLKDA